MQTRDTNAYFHIQLQLEEQVLSTRSKNQSNSTRETKGRITMQLMIEY